MKAVVLAVVGAGLSVLAFPPIGWAPLVIVGIALFFRAIREAGSPGHGFLIGYLYGLFFWGGVMWWLALLHWTALALVPLQALFTGLLASWLSRHNRVVGTRWLLLAVGGWAVMELIRYRFPVGGTEWGAAGYGMPWLRGFTPIVGTTGLTVLVVALAAALVLESVSAATRSSRLAVLVPVGILALTLLPNPFSHHDRGEGWPVAIVQGSGPCPFEDCPPDERLRTFEQHLELTRTIEAGSVDLVVWSESSTGSTNADPVLNPEIGEQIAVEARRIGAWILVGGDRTLSDTHWANVNVMFNDRGEIVGEYHKQLPVPFGEWVPLRPFFTSLIPELYRVPRDMIPGSGPVIFTIDPVPSTGSLRIGSVISWEGGFSRFARAHAREGATVMVVATNNESYGPTAPTADQFIGMTRMRAAELGVPVIHAAVTGKSVLIGSGGELLTAKSGLGTSEIVSGLIHPRSASVYAQTGDVVMILAVVLGTFVWLGERRLLVSTVPDDEEE